MLSDGVQIMLSFGYCNPFQMVRSDLSVLSKLICSRFSCKRKQELSRTTSKAFSRPTHGADPNRDRKRQKRIGGSEPSLPADPSSEKSRTWNRSSIANRSRLSKPKPKLAISRNISRCVQTFIAGCCTKHFKVSFHLKHVKHIKFSCNCG